MANNVKEINIKISVQGSLWDDDVTLGYTMERWMNVRSAFNKLND